MGFVLSLVLFLAFLAGIIAYAGDQLGTLVGKRRLSLFGARPKRSGQIVGVLAGILIMLLTLAIVFIVFQDRTRQFFDAQARIDELESQQQDLEAEAEVARANLEQSRRQLTAIDRERDQVQAQLNDTQTALNEATQNNERLNQENQNLIASVEQLSTVEEDLQERLAKSVDEVVELQSQEATLREERDEKILELAAIQQKIAAIEADNVSYEAGEIVYATLIEEETPEGIRAAVGNAIADAREEIIRRGSADFSPLSRDNTQAVFSEMEASADADILILESTKQHYRGDAIEVNLLTGVNDIILRKGSLLVSRHIVLREDDDFLRQAIVRDNIALLNGDALDRLKQTGQFVPEPPQHTNVTAAQFSDQLLRFNDSVTIGLMAAEDVFRGEVAKLEFVILH